MISIPLDNYASVTRPSRVPRRMLFLASKSTTPPQRYKAWSNGTTLIPNPKVTLGMWPGGNWRNQAWVLKNSLLIEYSFAVDAEIH